MRYVWLVLIIFLMIEPTDAARRKRRKHSAKRRLPRTEIRVSEQIEAQSSLAGSVSLPKVIHKIIGHGEALLGKRYRTRGIAPWALDCSGYVSYIYSLVGVSIPRSSQALSTFVQRVNEEPKPGDLLFFKGRNARISRVGHVAMVVENNSGDLVIMHSTNSRGIIKHRLNSDAYFRSRYLFAGRVPYISELGDDRLNEEYRPAPLAPQSIDLQVAPTTPKFILDSMVLRPSPLLM